MSARKEMQDEEDERSATRIGQDRRTGDYRGRGFPGDERRSPAGFHLIPSWLTTDSPLPLSSSLSIPYTYCLSFCFQPFTSADVCLFLFYPLQRNVPSSFYPPRLINPQLPLSFPLNTRFLSLVASLFTSIHLAFCIFLDLYPAFMIRLFLIVHSLCLT